MNVVVLASFCVVLTQTVPHNVLSFAVLRAGQGGLAAGAGVTRGRAAQAGITHGGGGAARRTVPPQQWRPIPAGVAAPAAPNPPPSAPLRPRAWLLRRAMMGRNPLDTP